MDFNLAFWLSIVLAASSCFGLLLAGRGKWQGWAVGLATQPVWAWFAIVTKSYGLLLVGAIYTGTYITNLWKWYKDEKRHQARDLYLNAWKHNINEPVGKVISVENTDKGLVVKSKLNEDFDFNFNPSPSSYSFLKDFEEWRRGKDIGGNQRFNLHSSSE